MELNILHETRYHYRPLVEHAQHLLHLKPRHTPRQQLLAHQWQIGPQPSQLSEWLDAYGNHRTFLALHQPHEQLQVTSVSQVRTLGPGPTPAPELAAQSWENTRERMRYQAGGTFEAASEFVFPSSHVPRHDDFARYARPSFPTGAALLPGLIDLMARIHSDFAYVSHSTDVNTPALQALAQRQGVCQDFAHIMIAGLRSLGLPARYVSGYLLTEPPAGQPRLIGSDASHAWVSAYLPAMGDAPGCWFDLDPTNHRCGHHSPGADYVTLAWGRDYADVPPLRGVIQGGTHHTLDVAVTVQAEPLLPLPTIEV